MATTNATITVKQDNKVSWGSTSTLGAGAGAVGLVVAILAFIEGDRSEQTLGVIAGGVLTLVSLLVTMVGRYAQAWIMSKQVKAPMPSLPLASGELVNANPSAAPVTIYNSVPTPADSAGVEFRAVNASYADERAAGDDHVQHEDLDDGVHALTDGDPHADTGTPVDETESTPDASIEPEAR